MPGFELFGIEEKKEIADVLESGILMRYGFDNQRKCWKADELEALLKDKFNVPYVHLVSSGTTALCTALSALGIGYGDEVLMPTFTFVASFEAVLSVGAIPKLVDIDESLTINPEAAQKAISSKTKAIMPVHMCGSMADLTPLKNICKENNLWLIEDSCQAIGGTYEGKYLGTIGDIGCFSFDFVKTITCGEGGAILTHNSELGLKISQFSDHGHDHLGANRGLDEHPFLGLNFRISELHAAIGKAQFHKLEQIINLQKTHYKLLEEALKPIKEINFRHIPDPSGNTYTFLSILLPSEQQARNISEALSKKAVPDVFYWYDNNWHYIRKWNHLKEAKTLNTLSPKQIESLNTIKTTDFVASNQILSRVISFSIKISLSITEIESRNKLIATIIQENLNK